MKLRVNEAIALSEAKGKKIMKKDIAAKIFEGSSESAQMVNMTNLCSGVTKRFKPEWIMTICEMCECTPNFLFGFEEKE